MKFDICSVGSALVDFTFNIDKEYCGKGLSGIFSNKSNLVNLNFLKMFFDIIKFYKKCDQINNYDNKITLGEYLEKNKLSKSFISLFFSKKSLLNLFFI